MSKVLLLTIAWPSKSNTNLYKDLMREFQNKGHDVFVFTVLEKRFGDKNKIENDGGIEVHRIASGNIISTGYVEKMRSLILLNRLLINYDKHNFENNFFDLILVSTPPITISGVVKKLKQKHNSFVYLLLKDMWPHGAVDAGILKENGIIWSYLKRHERRILRTSDKIGCMSPAAIEFVLLKNPELERTKVEVCPNSLAKIKTYNRSDKSILSLYNIPGGKILLIYGGNISLSHSLNFLINCLKSVINNSRIHFVIVGSGTHYKYLKDELIDNELTNVSLLERLPSDDYLALLKASDIGIAMLNANYTVPQFPSKIIDYLRLSKPVLSINNKHSDIGKIIMSNEAGFCIDSYEVKDFKKIIDRICDNTDILEKFQKNAFDLFNRDYTTEKCYEIIMKSFSDNALKL